MQRFTDRTDAGNRLAAELRGYRGTPGGIVLALPRGGVVLGAVVARELHLPFDVCLVRKLGVPWQPELAMGALAIGEVVVLDDGLLQKLGIPQLEVEREIALERQELSRRERLYRRGRDPLQVSGRTVFLIDDGIATGATMSAAIAAMRRLGAAKIIVGVGVAPAGTIHRLARQADTVVSVLEPPYLGAVGEWFEDFPSVEDATVLALLHPASAPNPQPAQEAICESR
ncbi:MAG: phosphoribosyltransferase [Acidobacteriota bacterium]